MRLGGLRRATLQVVRWCGGCSVTDNFVTVWCAVLASWCAAVWNAVSQCAQKRLHSRINDLLHTILTFTHASTTSCTITQLHTAVQRELLQKHPSVSHQSTKPISACDRQHTQYLQAMCKRTCHTALTPPHTTSKPLITQPTTPRSC